MGVYDNIYLTGWRSQTLSFPGVLNHDSTVEDFKKLIHERIGLSLEKINLHMGNTNLDQRDNDTFKSLNVQNGTTFFIAIKQIGGSCSLLRRGESPDKECCIEGEDCDRILWPCGHVVSVGKIPDYVNQMVEQDKLIAQNGKVYVPCIHSWECKETWALQECLWNGMFSYSEKQRILKMAYIKETTSSFGGLIQCTKCKSSLMKPDEGESTKMQCGCCSNIFCWKCTRTWSMGSGKYCTNRGCDPEMRQRLLRDSPRKEIQGYKNAPILRACPNPDCGVLIEHTTECRRMNCQLCKQGYCHVCLARYVQGKTSYYPCENGGAGCRVAPIQQIA